MFVKKLVRFIFTSALFLLALQAPAQEPQFTCGELVGTYECKGQSTIGLIEFSGDEVNFIDNAVMPIIYKLDAGKKEASSEKQHVSYTGSCDKKRIYIEANVTDINSEGSTKPKKIETTLTLNSQGEIALHQIQRSANLLTPNTTTCTRIEF